MCDTNLTDVAGDFFLFSFDKFFVVYFIRLDVVTMNEILSPIDTDILILNNLIRPIRYGIKISTQYISFYDFDI